VQNFHCIAHRIADVQDDRKSERFRKPELSGEHRFLQGGIVALIVIVQLDLADGADFFLRGKLLDLREPVCRQICDMLSTRRDRSPEE
jgi:hypothetical protein